MSFGNASVSAASTGIPIGKYSGYGPDPFVPNQPIPLSSSITTGDSAGSGLGKAYAITQGLSALATLAGGFAGMSAARDEASLLESQADLAREEGELEATAKAREVTRFQQRQAHMYASSGMTNEGTPALVMEETRRLGQQEVDMIRKATEARSNILRKKAGMTRKSGRNSFLSSILGAGSEGAQAYMLGKRYGLFNKKTASATPLPPVTNPNPRM
jgi:hypothetical protein